MQVLVCHWRACFATSISKNVWPIFSQSVEIKQNMLQLSSYKTVYFPQVSPETRFQITPLPPLLLIRLHRCHGLQDETETYLTRDNLSKCRINVACRLKLKSKCHDQQTRFEQNITETQIAPLLGN